MHKTTNRQANKNKTIKSNAMRGALSTTVSILDQHKMTDGFDESTDSLT